MPANESALIDHTHSATARSWLDSANTSDDFPVQNLPLGVFSTVGGEPHIGVAIGDQVLDLAATSVAALLPESLRSPLTQPTLNDLFARPSSDRRSLRHHLFELLTDRSHQKTIESCLRPAQQCHMHSPARIGDYTDFYAGIHHANNIGLQLRPDNPLLPNYKYVPIGYHGRASSIRVSGAAVVRPNGQRKPLEAPAPEFGPCRRLDYELELGVWIAGENALGTNVPIDHAADRIAGFCILNDWSARDFQAWEYQPLGPFLAKNFLTTISPWVITAEAMAPFRIAQPARPAGDPAPLPYLTAAWDQAQGAFAIEFEVLLASAAMRQRQLPPMRLCAGPASNLYWTVAQLIAHHTSNGCNLSAGDLLGTGTISGPSAGSFGSLMETSHGGRTPITLPSGETRSFLEDGDEVIMRATAAKVGRVAIGFGECRGIVLSRP